ncbi:hypothetical protein JXA80_10245 [bacterium]|nr:hypothetical protein [candidate division CSSED10-310 bacterium]
MNASASPDSARIIVHRFHDVSHTMEPLFRDMATEFTGKAIDYLATHRGGTDAILAETGRMIGNLVLDRITGDDILRTIEPLGPAVADSIRREWRLRFAYTLRKIAPDPVIPVPRIHRETPAPIWAIGSGLGALIGTLLVHMLKMEATPALAMNAFTAPLGALAGVYTVRWLARQRALLPGFARSRSIDDLDEKQLRVILRAVIDSHLHVVLLLALVTTRLVPVDRSENVKEPDHMPIGLLNALMKLIQAPVETRKALTEEVIQEFCNAGYDITQEADRLVWREGLADRFDVVGIVQAGDMCRVLQLPVIQNGRVRRKGRVTKWRE